MKIQVIACFLLIGVTVHYGKLSEKKKYSYRSTNIIVLANRCNLYSYEQGEILSKTGHIF